MFQRLSAYMVQTNRKIKFSMKWIVALCMAHFTITQRTNQGEEKKIKIMSNNPQECFMFSTFPSFFSRFSFHFCVAKINTSKIHKLNIFVGIWSKFLCAMLKYVTLIRITNDLARNDFRLNGVCWSASSRIDFLERERKKKRGKRWKMFALTTHFKPADPVI